ncbi:hypothetical protein [Deinococcus altitudinis]|uniref:hypothetical protein n=1 Tax=Deinococcus altitudinis TaxID=468914 RepID=UPI003891AB4C
MTQRSDTEGKRQGLQESGQETAEIVISGLDEPEGQANDPVNPSPTDEAIQRLQNQRVRGEPEDEDG